MYERLVQELKLKRPDDAILRVGDISAGQGCTALTLHVTVNGFKKGNQALRASTGPLRLFLGTTSLVYRVKLDDLHGNTVFESSMKKSKRTDSNSLSVARDIAKSISGKMKSEMKKTRAVPSV